MKKITWVLKKLFVYLNNIENVLRTVMTEIFLDLAGQVPNHTTPLKMAEDFVKNYQVDKADFSGSTSFETISSTISVEVNHKEEFVKSIFTSHEDSQDVGRNTRYALVRIEH